MTTHELALSQLPLDELHDSPYQPRTVYTGLDGLADSIRADGVQQPLKVRPIMPNPLRDDIVSGWEIVFGHRRKRAAELAVRSAMRGTPWTQDDLLMVVRHVLDQCERDQAQLLAELWGADNHALLADTLEAMPHIHLAQLLLDLALTHQVPVSARWDIQHEPQALLDAAHRYGVDVAAARAEPATEAQAA